MICKKFQEKGLRVHHIFSWDEHKELRFVVENAATMCDVCHDEEFKDSFHNIYGTSNNTLEQFIEYYEEKTGLDFDFTLLVA